MYIYIYMVSNCMFLANHQPKSKRGSEPTIMGTIGENRLVALTHPMFEEFNEIDINWHKLTIWVHQITIDKQTWNQRHMLLETRSRSKWCRLSPRQAPCYSMVNDPIHLKYFEMVRTGYGSLLFGPGIPDQRFFIKNLNLSQVIELDFMVILMVLICFNMF